MIQYFSAYCLNVDDDKSDKVHPEKLLIAPATADAEGMDEPLIELEELLSEFSPEESYIDRMILYHITGIE